MPLCRDCTHCLPDHDARRPFIDARCERLTYTDPVSGETMLRFCGIERSSLVGDCGLQGKLFEPRAETEGKTPADATLGA